jgi:hypothetical protein
MAKAILSAMFSGLRGRLGGVVFRQRGDLTIAGPRPRNSGRASTPNQVAHRERFRRAAAYGQSVLADPALRAIYEARTGQRSNVYRTALTDAIQSPVIDALETEAFRGAIGDPIVVRAHDDFAVTGVTVAVKDAAGTTLEQGVAQAAAGAWTYAATRSVAPGTTVTIEVTAVDQPGNATSLSRPVTV